MPCVQCRALRIVVVAHVQRSLTHRRTEGTLGQASLLECDKQHTKRAFLARPRRMLHRYPITADHEGHRFLDSMVLLTLSCAEARRSGMPDSAANGGATSAATTPPASEIPKPSVRAYFKTFGIVAVAVLSTAHG